jgi:hypothetical protein
MPETFTVRWPLGQTSGLTERESLRLLRVIREEFHIDAERRVEPNIDTILAEQVREQQAERR